MLDPIFHQFYMLTKASLELAFKEIEFDPKKDCPFIPKDKHLFILSFGWWCDGIVALFVASVGLIGG